MIKLNKYRIVDLSGLEGVSQYNMKACFITHEKNWNLNEILKCGFAFTSAGGNGAINVWLNDNMELKGELMRYGVVISSKTFNSVSEAKICILLWMNWIN